MSPEQHERAVEIFETTIGGVEYSDQAERTPRMGRRRRQGRREHAGDDGHDHVRVLHSRAAAGPGRRVRGRPAPDPHHRRRRRRRGPHLPQLRLHRRPGLLRRLLVDQ